MGKKKFKLNMLHGGLKLAFLMSWERRMLVTSYVKYTYKYLL